MTFMTKSSFQSNGRRSNSYDLLCFSHLRWDFVFQRPQHLMTRFARDHRVFFIEEPIFGDDGPRLEVSKREDDLLLVVPRLPTGSDVEAIMPDLIDGLRRDNEIEACVLWFYTPMMLRWKDSLQPLAVVYDCMDELSLFRNAPAELIE